MEDLSSIPQYKSWDKIIPVQKGWSGDKKYHIYDSENREFLLRTNSSESYPKKLEEFRMMAEVVTCGIHMSVPLDMGLFDDGRSVFTLLSWVEGVDAEQQLFVMPEAEQYMLGFGAGETLRKIHSLPAPDSVESWGIRYGKKIDSKLRKYLDCPVRIDSDTSILDFIQENRVCIQNRPQTFQHGDFHVGNLIVTPRSTIGVVDFNRIDYGDPWEEFNRIVFCADISPSFATGRIDGYFDSNVPDSFFTLMALYIAVNSISAIPWAIPFGEQEVKTMLSQAERILDFYRGFSSVVPRWYVKPELVPNTPSATS